MEWTFKEDISYDKIYLGHAPCNAWTAYTSKFLLICPTCHKKVPANIVTQIKLLNDFYSKAIIPSEDWL